MRVTRTNYALIARAARMIQNNADSVRRWYALRGEWGANRGAQLVHDDAMSTVRELRALLVPAPAKAPPKIPEGDVLLHLARSVGLTYAMHSVDAASAKDLLWKFIAATIAMMDETDIVDAEFAAPGINYVDDLAVAEHIHSDKGACHVRT